MKSITKAAEELGVSRTKIYTLLKNSKIETKKVSKENLISDEDFEKIKKIVLNESNEQLNSDETNELVDERMKNILDRDRNNIYSNISDREYTDLKERIRQLEQQIDRKDKQIQEQSEQLIESLKANSNLIESNSQLNIMVYKTLNPPQSNECIVEVAVDKSENDSWIKRFFKK